MRKILLSLVALAALSAKAGALSPADLPTAEERTRYEQLAATNKADADAYLATRDYVRKAKAVVEGNGKGALEFPGKPKNFASKYLAPDGSEKDVINAAVKLSIQAMSESRYA